MADISLMIPVPDELQGARDLFLEQNASTAVMNTYLRIALTAVSAVALGLLALLIKDHQAARDVKIVVVRVNEIGRAEAVNYTPGPYKVQESESKYFLAQFVHDHYGRMRATMKENFARSLFFVEGRMAEEIMERQKRTKALEPFLSGQTDEIDVQVKNVAIEDIRKAPYHATVDYEKIYYNPSSHQEVRRERYVGNFVFAVKEQVANAMIPVNPLGLTITYFREDQAFGQTP